MCVVEEECDRLAGSNVMQQRQRGRPDLQVARRRAVAHTQRDGERCGVVVGKLGDPVPDRRQQRVQTGQLDVIRYLRAPDHEDVQAGC